MRDQRTLFDLTQDGLVIGNKIQRIYPEFDVDAFVSGCADGGGRADALQCDEHYRTGPASAPIKGLLRSTRYLDGFR